MKDSQTPLKMPAANVDVVSAIRRYLVAKLSPASRQLPKCRAGRAKALRDEVKNLGKIADALASDFNLKKLDATRNRILNRA